MFPEKSWANQPLKEENDFETIKIFSVILQFHRKSPLIVSQLNLKWKIICSSTPLCSLTMCMFSLSLRTVLIVCSSLDSLTTQQLIDKFRAYNHTKILLIDMLANVFDDENRFYRSFDAQRAGNNLVVLTAVTQKFEQILFGTFTREFQRYLALNWLTNETIFCDLRLHNGTRDDEMMFSDAATCFSEVKRRCSNYTNVDIKSYCSSITQQRKDGSSDTARMNASSTTFNKQLAFTSEHASLFDFITSSPSFFHHLDSSNAGNQESRYQFDFIVLDFKSIHHGANNSTSWRPLMILKQDQFDANLFTMHRASSDDDDMFNDWLLPPFERCEALCWSAIAAAILILIVLIVVLGVWIGIAARWVTAANQKSC